MNAKLNDEVPEAVQPLLERVLAERENSRPTAKGHTGIGLERKGRVPACVPWPEDGDTRIARSEPLANIATDILVGTDSGLLFSATGELESI